MISVVDERRSLLASWLENSTPFQNGKLSVASADASFRRYFRLHHAANTYIVMDAPPELEPSDDFVKIGSWMRINGIHVPEILAQDLKLGFLVLSDFGDIHFQDALNKDNKSELYQMAIDEIIKFQKFLVIEEEKLPVFDSSWQWKELEIFWEWCLPNLSEAEFRQSFEILVKLIDEIPKAFMHRDFHCRNLLVCPDGNLGIIDFQGAMHGPITYDLVSLLRDCYIDNEENWIEKKVANFQQNLISEKFSYATVESDEFIRWFDWVGLQRHLKCVGIFNRLNIRDGKPEYMREIPRVLNYLSTVLKRYPELKGISHLLRDANISN